MATRRLQQPCIGTALSGHARRQENVLFYEGECHAAPNRETLLDILHGWRGDYRTLERNHTYIQWLFPIEERGVNPYAQPLRAHEAETIKSSPRLSARFLEAYKMMLDFYGAVLMDEAGGTVARSEHWRPRLRSMVHHPHNFLRVTRILKCLGLLGREHFKAPLLRHFVILLEQPDSHLLANSYANSLLDFWIPTLEDTAERERLFARARIAASGAPIMRRSESGPGEAEPPGRPALERPSLSTDGEERGPRGHAHRPASDELSDASAPTDGSGSGWQGAD